MLAKSYLDRRERIVAILNNNLRGKDWALGLLERHKCVVAQQVSRNISKARAKVSRATLISFLD